MVKKLLILLAALVVLMGFYAISIAQEKGEAKAEAKKATTHEYIGAKKCALCHKKDGVYPSWMETKHAKAWDALSEADQKNEKCVGCHTTGTTAKGELLEGVQCEACHGPGSDFFKMSIMKDKEKAIANGLIIPDSTTCMKCHNKDVPAQFQPKGGYNFAEMMKTGLHTMPAKEEKK